MDQLTTDHRDADELARALTAAEAQVHALREEIEETNRGVLALYAELDAQAEHLSSRAASWPI